MGQENSTNILNHSKPFDSFIYSPVPGSHNQFNYSYGQKTYNYDQYLSDKKVNVLQKKAAYNGIWNMQYPESLCPEPRIGQIFAYDSEKDRLIIAYGSNKSNKMLQDMWSLKSSETPYKWELISFTLNEPRRYASCTLIDRELFVFGGESVSSEGIIIYYNDLHSINIDSGKITQYNTNGAIPSPRISPIMHYFDNQIVIWSGFDGRIHNGIHLLNLETMTWKRMDEEQTGISSPCGCKFNNDYYVYGGPSGSNLSIFQPTDNIFNYIKTRGIDPPSNLSNACLVPADEYLFLIGGENSHEFMYIYGYDTTRKWWFAFHIKPDNITLTEADGIVNKIGIFMIPREHSAAVVYSPKCRELVSVMGSRFLDPAPVFKISIGEALASMHLRSDMLEMLDFNNFK